AEQVEEIGYRCGPIIEARTLREIAVRCRELTKHRVVFIADNAQELFLKLSQAARDELAEQVAGLIADPDGDARFLLVIREDYLGDLYELSSALPGVMGCLMRVRKFSRAQAEDAIVKPASSFGIQFERDLVGQIIEDLDREGVLPAHIQIVCHRLLEEAGPGRTYVGSMLYRRLGGARKILDEYVDHAVSQLPVTDRRLAWQVLRSLAGVSETLAAVSLNELAEQVRGSRVAFDRVLARLVDLRLLRLYDRGRTRYVELIHDLLAEDIRRTLASRQPATAQSVHDILARGLDNFRLTGQLLERGETYAVNDERADLTLTAQELELVIRSALEHDIEADYWLGRLGELRDGAYRVLADALAREDPRIRAQAMKHAREHLGQPLIEPLVKLATSDLPERKQAEDLLRSMERDLVAALSSDDSSLRGWAATALSKVNGKRHLKDLAGALSDDHPTVTERVADALAEMDAVRSARLLLASLRGRDNQWAMAEAVGRLAQSPAVTSMLHKAMARQPASPYLAYAYGVAQSRQRRYEEAMETLSRAKALAEKQGVQAGPVEASLARVEAALMRARRGEDRWAMAGGSPYHTGYVADALPPPLREFWTTTLDAEVVGGVVVAHGLAFAGLRRGIAVCIDTASGAVRWKRRLDDRVEAAPALSADRLLLVTADGSVVALDFSGNHVGEGRAGAAARAPLTVADDLVLVGDRAGLLTALSAQDLSPRWRYQFGAEVTGPPTCRHGLVYAGSWDASVVALDAESGEVVWRWVGDGPVAGAVAAAEEILGWVNDSGVVIAAEPSTGEVIWQTQLASGSRAGVAMSPELLVVGCLDGLARCLSLHDGSSVWDFPTDDQILAPALIVGEVVYVGSRDGRLYGLDLHTGEHKWSYATSYGIYASPAVVEGVMMAVLRQRQVVAFVPEEETAG
ncbi:MAG: PQQ-binding-like beta-propeller repeat protein, partial [Armatimonadetes bacterium]|nr:PQQ-binding-like beta-propeller repeat protein [Armatimonadota bacterium]